MNLIWERHYNNGALPTLYPWTDILCLIDSFKGLAMVNVFDGATCLFWDDLWLNKVPRIHYPHLFSFAKSKDVSIRLARDAPEALFNLPLSFIAAS